MSARLPLGSGRSLQKQRTRDALVAAARELVAAGETPTIEDAAEAAPISRTSAYRYFGSQAEPLAAAHPEAAVAAPPATPASAPVSAPAAVSGDLAARALEQYQRALAAQREGDWAGYGVEIRVKRDRTANAGARSYYVSGEKVQQTLGFSADRGAADAVITMWDALERGDFGLEPDKDPRFFNIRWLKETVMAGVPA